MPLQVLQSNHRVAEVQFLCDNCGKQVKTGLIKREELETQKNTKVICCQCKDVQNKKK